jgi:pimeloyl-ACP methyl ester carboxylesterase
MAPRPRNREEAIELAVRARSVIGGKGFPVDEAKVREQAAIAFDRCYHPAGFLRQIAAIMAADSRAAGLSGLRLPVTVIHGLDDPLVPPENGRRTASAIPGAELVEIEGMGHDLPEGAWPRIVDAISAAAARAEARAR